MVAKFGIDKKLAQIGAALPCFSLTLLPPPFGDFRVIPAQQNLWDLKATPLLRLCVAGPFK